MRLRATSMGSGAAGFLRRHGCAQVAAVFERSMHLEAGDDVLCVVGSGLGSGPLNLVVERLPRLSGPHAVPPAGSDVRISEDELRIGGLILDASAAEAWRPPPWPGHVIETTLRAGLACVGELAARSAPADGLARLTLCAPPGELHTASSLERIAAPRLQALEQWLLAGRASRDAGTDAPVIQAAAASGHATSTEQQGAGHPPTELVGLGPGLTPSGDDLLCGAMIALHALGRRHDAVALAAAVDRTAREATTRLSRAFLRASGEGHGSELLHETIGAVLAGDNRGLAPLVDRTGRVGHTSGWDALAGAVLALRASMKSVDLP